MLRSGKERTHVSEPDRIARDDCPNCRFYNIGFDCCSLTTNGLPCRPEQVCCDNCAHYDRHNDECMIAFCDYKQYL